MSLEARDAQPKRYGGFEGVRPIEEQTYYQNYWQRLAHIRNTNVIDDARRNDIPKERYESNLVTDVDVMREAAERDNKQYDKWLSPESQAQNKELLEFFKDWRAVRDNSPDRPTNFKLVAVAMGAGIASGQQTGQDMFLQDEGLAELIDVSVATSGASGPVLFRTFEDGSRRAASLFMNECMTAAFVHNRFGGQVPYMDSEVILREMAEGKKSVDVRAMRASRGEVWGVVTNKRTGKAELKNMSTAPDPLLICKATSAIPGMKIQSVEIDGEVYVDGAFSDLPLEEIIERFKPTHLLLQPNRAFEFLKNFKNTLSEDIIKHASSALGSLVPHAYSLSQLYKMKERVNAALQKIGKMHNIKIAILWPPDEELGVFTQDPDMMRIGITEAYRKTVSETGGKQPERIRLFPGDNLEDIGKTSDAV